MCLWIVDKSCPNKFGQKMQCLQVMTPMKEHSIFKPMAVSTPLGNRCELIFAGAKREEGLLCFMPPLSHQHFGSTEGRLKIVIFNKITPNDETSLIDYECAIIILKAIYATLKLRDLSPKKTFCIGCYASKNINWHEKEANILGRKVHEGRHQTKTLSLANQVLKHNLIGNVIGVDGICKCNEEQLSSQRGN